MNRFLAGLAAAGIYAATAGGAQAEDFVRMASGPEGGTWHALGNAITEAFGKEIPGISATNGPGGGVSNVKAVNRSSVEIGWSQGHTVYDGYTGKGVFDRRYEDVRFFAALYPAALQTAVPADAPIKGYADLHDKRLSPGKTQWSSFAAFEMVAGHYGFSVGDVKKNGGTVHHVSYSDSVALMKDGHIDAFAALTALPQASFLDLEFSPGIRFLAVEQDILDKIMAANPGYISLDITRDHYKSLSAPVTTLGTVAVLVVHKDLPEDLAYKMAGVLWDHHADFVGAKAVWRAAALETALSGAAIPVHPGAMRYYREKGVAQR